MFGELRTIARLPRKLITQPSRDHVERPSLVLASQGIQDVSQTMGLVGNDIEDSHGVT